MHAVNRLSRLQRTPALRALLLLAAAAWLLLGLTSVQPASASGPNAIRAGFTANTLPRNDDASTAAINIGFQVKFFSQTYTQLYVNNNGNVTFNGPMPTYSPFDLTSTSNVIIAPFFADVDTRPNGSNPVTYAYGAGSVNGRNAFGVTYSNVGFFDNRVDKLNSFQVILIDRSDIAAGAFDIEFNYDQIQWETGNASGGTNGLGGFSARAGFSNGTGAVGTSYELPGSAVNGAFLDSNSATGLIHNSQNSNGQLGRYIFRVRNGQPQFEICGDGVDNNEDGRADEYCAAPTAIAGGPYTVSEGSSVTLNGSGTDPDADDVLAYAWDLDNNGSFETAGATATFSAASIDGPATRPVSFRVTDRLGNARTITTNIAITNVAPSPAISGASASITYGATLSLSASATDPGMADTASGFAYAWSVTGGVLTTPVTGSGSSFSFSPPGAGNYTISLNATDDDGGIGSVNAGVQVNPATLTVTADPVSRAFGAANPAFTASYAGYINGGDAAEVIGNLVCTSTATPSSPPGAYPIDCSASTLVSPKYTIGYVAGTLTVTAASTTTTVGDSQGTAGTSATFAATVTSVAGVVSEGMVEFTVKQGVATVGSPVSAPVINGDASATFSLVAVSSGNYDIEARYLPASVTPSFLTSSAATTGKLTVSAPLVVTNLSVSGSGSYGATATLSATLTAAAGATLPGRVVNFTLNGVAVCGGSLAACPATDGGGTAVLEHVSTASLAGSTPYVLTATYAGESGYLEATATGSLTLARIAQTITFPHPGNVIYGALPLALGAHSTSGLAIHYTTSSPCAIVNDTALRIEGAGTCEVEAAQEGNSDYLPAESQRVTVTIARAPLTLRADNATSQFGASLPCTVSPVAPNTFVNGDDVADLDGTLVCATTPTTITTLGTYPLRPSGLTSANYTITYQNGTLTVIRCATKVTLTLLPGNSVTYSDLVTFRAQLTTCSDSIVPGSTIIPAGPLQVALSGATFGSKTFNASGVAEFQAPMLRAAQEDPYSVTAVFSSNDVRFSGATAAPSQMTVAQEEASVTYSGVQSFPVNAVSKKGSVQLKVNLVEVLDSSLGDIRTARVRFVYHGGAQDGQPVNAACGNLTVTLVGGQGQASCSFQSTAATFSVRAEVFGNYLGQTSPFTITVGNGGAAVRLPATLLGELWATRREGF